MSTYQASIVNHGDIKKHASSGLEVKINTDDLIESEVPADFVS
jgi:hypothetical protein